MCAVAVLALADTVFEWRLSGQTRAQHVTTITETYNIDTGVRTSDPAVIEAAAGLPKRFDAHSSYERCIVSGLRFFRTKTPEVWRAVVTYSDQACDPETRNNSDDPTIWAPVVSHSEVTYMVYPLFDLDGEPIENTAHDKFADGVPVPKSFRRVRISRYELSYNEGEAALRQNAINDGPISAGGEEYPEAAIKIAQIEGAEARVNGYTVYAVTYELHINLQKDENGDVIGWDAYLLNAGSRELVEIAGKTEKRYVTYNGLASTNPVPLDATGKAIPGDEVSPATLIYKRFRVHEKIGMEFLLGADGNWGNGTN